MTYSEGKRIFYTGDQCNRQGFGTIVRAFTDKWGSWVDLQMDDGRNFANTPATSIGSNYRGHCNPRFVTKESYDNYRAEALKQYTNG